MKLVKSYSKTVTVAKVTAAGKPRKSCVRFDAETPAVPRTAAITISSRTS